MCVLACAGEQARRCHLELDGDAHRIARDLRSGAALLACLVRSAARERNVSPALSITHSPDSLYAFKSTRLHCGSGSGALVYSEVVCTMARELSVMTVRPNRPAPRRAAHSGPNLHDQVVHVRERRYDQHIKIPAHVRIDHRNTRCG